MLAGKISDPNLIHIYLCFFPRPCHPEPRLQLHLSGASFWDPQSGLSFFRTSSSGKRHWLSKWLTWAQVNSIFKIQWKDTSYVMSMPRGRFMPVFVFVTLFFLWVHAEQMEGGDQLLGGSLTKFAIHWNHLGISNKYWCLTTRKDLKGIMQSKIGQTEKGKTHMISHVESKTDKQTKEWTYWYREQIGGCLRWGVSEMGEEGQKIQTPSYKEVPRMWCRTWWL